MEQSTIPATRNGAATRPSFDNILNFRDVGATINQFTGRRLIAEGILFRAARPDDASLSDRKSLRNDFGIKTVIDLRTKSEHVKQAKKRRADLETPVLLQSNDAIAEPVKIPGMDYLEINLNGKGFERSLIWQLSLWSFVKLVVLMLFGYRMEAISVLGREVMQPRGLIGLGRDSIDHCGPEICNALLELSSSRRYPVMIHCTQGKDRTGLIIALLLFLLDVPLDAITYDYTLSEAELLPERDSRLVEIREIGLSDDFAGTPKDFILQIHHHLEQKYGGITGYLHIIGVDDGTKSRLVEVLQG